MPCRPDILQIGLIQKLGGAVIKSNRSRPNRDETVVVLEHDASPVKEPWSDGIAGGNRVPTRARILSDIELTRDCRGPPRPRGESPDRQIAEVVLEKNVRRCTNWVVEIICEHRVP